MVFKIASIDEKDAMMNMMLGLVIAGIVLVALLLLVLLAVFLIWPMIRRSQAKSSADTDKAVVQNGPYSR
jgi:hypothetical protein